MIGFDGRHTRAHIYRAILEGIALTMKNNIDAMQQEVLANDSSAVPIKQIIISGGGANSELFLQIFADVFNIEVVRNKVNDSAGLGAAMNAAIGLGIFDNFAIATEEMVHIKSYYQPNQANYQLYKDINETTYQKINQQLEAI